MSAGTIVVMGGGGFSHDGDNRLLDDHLLSHVEPRFPKVCFVPTASGDAEDYVERFLDSFTDLRAQASVLHLFRRELPDLRAHVLAQDIVYVGGGNTANLLAVWRVHGLDKVFAEAASAGVVLAGLSAGMNCWFESSVTDSFGPALQPLHDGLGLLAGSACPHYDGEEERRPTYLDLVARGVLPAGHAVEDDCALVFRDGVLAEAVSSRAGARAFRVVRDGDGADEQPLPVRFLG
jgi:dipeptidase E